MINKNVLRCNTEMQERLELHKREVENLLFVNKKEMEQTNSCALENFMSTVEEKISQLQEKITESNPIPAHNHSNTPPNSVTPEKIKPNSLTKTLTDLNPSLRTRVTRSSTAALR